MSGFLIFRKSNVMFFYLFSVQEKKKETETKFVKELTLGSESEIDVYSVFNRKQGAGKC